MKYALNEWYEDYDSIDLDTHSYIYKNHLEIIIDTENGKWMIRVMDLIE